MRCLYTVRRLLRCSTRMVRNSWKPISWIISGMTTGMEALVTISMPAAITYSLQSREHLSVRPRDTIPGDYEDYEATPGENFGVSFLMTLGISMCVSIIICLLLLLKMHTVHQKTEANDYVSEKLKLSRKEDRYTHTTQTRRKIERESSSSSSTQSESGGGGSGRSGKF